MTHYKYAGSLYRNGVDCAAASIQDFYSACGTNGDREILDFMLSELAGRQALGEGADNEQVAEKIRQALAKEDWELPESVDGRDIVIAFERVLKEANAVVNDADLDAEVRTMYPR